MRMNSSRTENPSFWGNSFIRLLHTEHGYKTGIFGKLLNQMGDYGCDGIKSAADGLDRNFAMCNAAFYNEQWSNFTLQKDGTMTGAAACAHAAACQTLARTSPGPTPNPNPTLTQPYRQRGQDGLGP